MLINLEKLLNKILNHNIDINKVKLIYTQQIKHKPHPYTNTYINLQKTN